MVQSRASLFVVLSNKTKWNNKINARVFTYTSTYGRTDEKCGKKWKSLQNYISI